MITEIGNGLIGIKVPADAKYFYKEKIDEDGFELQFISGGEEHGIFIEYDFDTLGIITKDHIGFDCNPYVEKYNDGSYRDYESKYPFAPDCDCNDIYLTKEEAFCSKLASYGLYFVNPMGKNDITAWWEVNKWQSYEDNLIEKLLIIQKK